jgi:hypothetical protein
MDEVWLPLPEWLSMADWPFAGVLPESISNLLITQSVANLTTGDTEFKCLAPIELVLRIPGLDQLGLALGPAGFTEFILTLRPEPFSLSLRVPVELRVDANILRPLKPGTREPDETAKTFDIHVGDIGLVIDSEGNIDLDLRNVVTIPRCMVATSGVILQVGKMQWLTPATPPQQLPPNTVPGFTGLYFDDVIVEIPQLPAAVSAIRMDDVFLGTGGFSGKISQPNLALQWNGTNFTGAMHGELFGFKGGISAISIEFRQNALVGSQIEGDIFIPYLNKRVGLTLGLDGAGSLTATAALPHSLPAETGVTPGSAGYLIHLDVGNILSLDIASLRFNAPAGGVPRLGIAGRVAPGTGVLNFPPIEMTGLWIDARGRIQTEGDGVRLPSKYTLNFHGFQLEISKLGFGNTEDGGKWIGFTGGVRLVAGMPAGASVEGLRITWYEDGRPIQITLNGVRVDFEVPNAFKFSGAVSYDSARKQFHGAIKLDLIALKMQVDAVAVFGIHEGGQNYLAVYLAAQFPAGIPLFATGLGVYGMAGLFAINMEPNRQPDQAWYAIGTGEDWYHKSPVGVTDLTKKWTPRIGSLAFGAGVTLGTVADNGHTFSAQMLLAIVFPGPILLLQGSASLLKERATLDTDATFRAIAVLDGRAGTLTVGLDAQYRFDNSGALIDIRGAAEGFFNFNDPNAWRLNVGLKDPRERRLTARLFQLFEANAYLMLNAHELAMGAWIGFKQQWQFGPLSVALEAWLDGNARVSWKPAHFSGDLWLHGSVRLAVFGFAVGLTVDARIAADVFDPFHIVGQFSVAIDLPWPFPDFSANIKLEWGPNPSPPRLPLPLKEVAIEHFKATTSWPLPRSGSEPFLMPNYDVNGDGFLELPTGATIPSDPNHVPVVPLDCRPHLTFARNVHDDARVGVNPQGVVPAEERVGDPVTNRGPALIRYGLDEVILEKLAASGWTAVAGNGKTAASLGLSKLYGSWAPMPQMPGGGGRNTGQVKLWLWSKTLFEYTRSTSRAWDEWFADNFTGYPCGSIPDVCWDFEEIEPANRLPGPWPHPAEPDLIVRPDREIISIVELAQPEQGFTRALCLDIPDDIDIDLPQPTDVVRLKGLDLSSAELFSASDSNGVTYRATLESGPDGPYIEIRGKDLVSILIVYTTRNLPSRPLAKQVSAAVGCHYVPSRDQLVFVEFHGKLSVVDLKTNQYKVLGTGYTNPEDVVVTADGNTAYITERSGTLLRVDLTGSSMNRSNAVVISSGMTAPQQIALDETGGKAYVVEFTSSGRLLRIDLEGETVGQKTVLASGLKNAVGLIFTADWKLAYVSEQGDANRIVRINVGSEERVTVIDNLPGLFFLCWADEQQTQILVPQRRSEHSLVYRILLFAAEIVLAEELITEVPFQPSSVAVLPDGRLAVCSETVVTAYRFALCLLSICDVRGPLLVRHFEQELARWKQQAEVLEPHTQYRLKIVTSIRARGEGKLRWYSEKKEVTEFAYFRTDGPPGVAKLTAPIGSEAIERFTTPLDDLTRYVQRTMPRAVEPTPDTPVPSRLFYRAYDIGIEFNENYVDLMYRLGRRDLTIHLYDSNGAIRSENESRLVLANQWGLAEEVTLTELEERWRSVLESSGCTLVDVGSVVKNTTFNASSEAHVLPPLALCEARLVPALLHDAFAGYGIDAGASGPGGKLERWQVHDDPGSTTSRWEIRAEGTPPDFVLVQTTKATTTLVYTDTQNDPDPPSNWTDYRLNVHLRSSDGRIGVVFRYRNAGQHYRFVMDRQAGKRELILITGGVPTVLAQNSFSYTPNQTYVISVEAVKSSLRVYQDDALIFAVTDAAISAGSVGVHCAGNSSARFTDIFVDDYRISAPVVYRFNFLSSRFRNFSDHLGSFENKTWRVELDPIANVAPLIGAAVLPSVPISDAESRAFEALFMLLPGVATAPASPVVRATRVERSGEAIAFLIQSPEPLHWTRIDLQVLRAELQTSAHGPVAARVLRKADGAALLIVVPASRKMIACV